MIHSIDDLKSASTRDIAEAKAALDLKARLLRVLTARGQQEGITKAEYLALCAKLLVEECECPHCKGTGKLKKKPPRAVGVIHPSSAYACVLRLYYDVVGEIAPKGHTPVAFQFVFGIGHAIHDVVQGALLEDLGAASFEPEKLITIGNLVRGFTDGIVAVPKARAVLEIKTMGAEFDGLKEPKPEHRVQAGGLYATALDAPFVVYLYVSKEWPHPIKEYVEEYDPSVFARWCRTKGDKVTAALESGVPPTADSKPYDCKDCPYGHACPQRLDKKGGKVFAVGPKVGKR